MTDPQTTGPAIGKRVAAYRRLNGWSMDELAKRARGAVSKSVIANLETGRRQDVTVPQLIGLAHALAIYPSALLTDVDVLADSRTEEAREVFADLGWYSSMAPTPIDGHISNATGLVERTLAACWDLRRKAEVVDLLMDIYAADRGDSHQVRARHEAFVDLANARKAVEDAARGLGDALRDGARAVPAQAARSVDLQDLLAGDQVVMPDATSADADK